MLAPNKNTNNTKWSFKCAINKVEVNGKVGKRATSVAATAVAKIFNCFFRFVYTESYKKTHQPVAFSYNYVLCTSSHCACVCERDSVWVRVCVSKTLCVCDYYWFVCCVVCPIIIFNLLISPLDCGRGTVPGLHGWWYALLLLLLLLSLLLGLRKWLKCKQAKNHKQQQLSQLLLLFVNCEWAMHAYVCVCLCVCCVLLLGTSWRGNLLLKFTLN